jgi:hypothetical protein
MGSAVYDRVAIFMTPQIPIRLFSSSLFIDEQLDIK